MNLDQAPVLGREEMHLSINYCFPIVCVSFYSQNTLGLSSTLLKEDFKKWAYTHKYK